MKKRLFSALLAVVMLFSFFVPVSSLGQVGDKYPYYPYIDEDGTYYRIYNGEEKPFNTDWNSIVDYVATELKALKRSVSFDFATSDENFAYIYNTTRDTSSLSGDDIYSLLMSDVAQLIGTDGYTIGAHSTVGYMNDSDYPYGNNARYYPFTITLSSITYSNTDSLSLPSTDENGIYYRRSNGVALAFNTDYDQMISYIQNRLISRRNQITYYFATSDPEYIYNESNSAEIREQFIRDVMTDVYKKDSALPSNAGGGDYLFKSIKKVVIGSIPYTPAEDNPTEGNTRYSVFYFSLRNICYYTNFEQEEFIRRYCSDFSEKFIREDASDYDKVKTIYDFVVRNTKYDWDVFTDREKYPVNSERYTVAHSAYGALRGNLDEEESFSWSNKQSITGENIISTADQGLAVCEGYSKLFYYLCVMNGIPCRIVDGDYVDESGKGSDPHEWNYVWLDDGCGDGYKWFEVDTTFAAQNSFKDVDMNNYDYFLCGRENINFGYMNHQQPYHIDNTSIDAAFVIYDYWGDNGDSTYVSSKEDYQFRKLNFNNIDALQGGYIVRRSTEYEGDTDVKVALIHSTKDDQYIINIDDNGDVLPTDIHGFIYNGQPQSVYEVFIPYLDIKEYEIDKLTGIKDAGQYTINIKGANNTFVQISFNIIPMDLDNSHEGNYDYDTLNIQKSAVYTGNTITPKTYIVDGYKNVLEEGKDYEVVAYKDSAHTQKTDIKDIGTYYVDINYEVGNNYSGHYYLTFKVNKIGMDEIIIDFNKDGIDDNDFEFPYLPESLRAQNNISSPADLFKAGSLNMTIGEYNVKVDKDYSVTSSGGLSWDESGILTLTGLSTSDVLASGTKKTIRYKITEKFDISSLDGQYADSGKTNVYIYNGKLQKPVRFDHLDGYLEQGVDYVIDSYSNNLNAGEASVKIKGINGCTGTATMHFYINKASIGNCVVSTKTSGGLVTCELTYNGKDLAKDKDYTETYVTTSSGYQIILTGINNFAGTYKINVKGTLVKPTSSGNYATLSTSSYTYSGSSKKPTVKVYNKNKKAISPIYYTVSYSNTISVGTGKVNIKFQNSNSETITKTYTIKPKGTTLSSVSAAKKAFTVKWKKQATQTTGYQIQYSTSSAFSSTKAVNVTKNTTLSKKITGLKAKKKYYVRIRTYKTVSGKKYYSSWSTKKSVKTK
ncbi:MAG: fibronectin type III domain-containing protein [Eubacterium sp.]|nr:fibronectin type III domain-containing protein [Eubacterium sp.]